jgi:hypothetical protein
MTSSPNGVRYCTLDQTNIEQAKVRIDLVLLTVPVVKRDLQFRRSELKDRYAFARLCHSQMLALGASMPLDREPPGVRPVASAIR